MDADAGWSPPDWSLIVICKVSADGSVNQIDSVPEKCGAYSPVEISIPAGQEGYRAVKLTGVEQCES